MRQIDLPAAALQQIKTVFAGFTNYKIELYVGADDLTKIKSFYKTQLEKAGWNDVTALFAAAIGYKDAFAQLETLGGFTVVLSKR
jgi:hypothetical protein